MTENAIRQQSAPPARARPPTGLPAAGVDLAQGLQAMQQDSSLRAKAEATAVGAVMAQGVVCVAADASLSHVTELLLDRDIGSAPVVDAAWRPVGMVSKTDLLRAYADTAKRPEGTQQTVSDIIEPLVLSLHEASPISVAAALMAYEGVHRLPIVASSGEVVGVVSTLDIVCWVAQCTHDEVLVSGA